MGVCNGMLTIVDGSTGGRVLQARTLFQEYAASIGVDLCFQGFQQELDMLPGDYAPPAGRLLLAFDDDAVAGCVALRPLEPGICEMKRLYVRPAFRGAGVGCLLVQRIIEEGRRAGYQRMRLDTLPSMEAAIDLYRQFGFSDIPPYRANPVESALFLELLLSPVLSDS